MASPLVPDTSNITNQLMQLFAQQGATRDQRAFDSQEADKEKAALEAQRRFKAAGAQAATLMKLPFTQQRTGAARLAKQAIEQGGDATAWERMLNIQDPDELNLALRQMAVNASDADKVISNALGGGGKRASIKSFQPITVINKATGEKRLVSPQTDPNTGLATLAPFDMPEGFEVSRETAEEKRNADLLAAQQKEIDKLTAKGDIEPQTQFDINQAKNAAAKAKGAFEQIDKIRANVLNLQTARQAVVDGAGTGPIEKLLPSFKAASIALDAAQGRLGLDIVQSTTFGALSKGELDLSKKIALPIELEGEDLINWIDTKMSAQEKLANYLEKQALFLSERDENGKQNTVAKWHKKEKAILNQALEAAGATEADIKATMKATGMDRSGVLSELRRRFENGGS